jgi:hypothetical protein
MSKDEKKPMSDEEFKKIILGTGKAVGKRIREHAKDPKAHHSLPLPKRGGPKWNVEGEAPKGGGTRWRKEEKRY